MSKGRMGRDEVTEGEDCVWTSFYTISISSFTLSEVASLWKFLSRDMAYSVFEWSLSFLDKRLFLLAAKRPFRWLLQQSR